MTEQRLKGLAVDRVALQTAVNEVMGEANSAWCIACGASKGAGPEIPHGVERRIDQNPEILDRVLEPAFVQGLAERLGGPDINANWCIGCGASKGVGPMIPEEIYTSRAALSDSVIRELASRFLGSTEE